MGIFNTLDEAIIRNIVNLMECPEIVHLRQLSTDFCTFIDGSFPSLQDTPSRRNWMAKKIVERTFRQHLRNLSRETVTQHGDLEDRYPGIIQPQFQQDLKAQWEMAKSKKIRDLAKTHTFRELSLIFSNKTLLSHLQDKIVDELYQQTTNHVNSSWF